MDHLTINLETILAIAFMLDIVSLDAYELHAGYEKIFIDLFTS